MTLSEAWVDGLAGWASGAMVVAVVQPIDTILTRAQASISLPTSIHDHPIRASTAATATTTTATTATTLSYYQLLRQLTHSFGVSSLWRGSAPMIYAVPLQNALLMGGYGMGKQWSSSHNRNDATNTNNHFLSVFIGGSVGGIAQSFLMSPVELIKVQQQIYVTNHGGGWSSSSSSLVHHWQRGLTATLLRDGIPHGVWFASYEWSKTELTRQLLDMEDPQDPPYGIGSLTTMNQVGVPMMAGAVAATVAWAVGYPFDIIKTRIQATNLLMTSAASSSSSSSTMMPPLPPPPKGVYETGMELVHEFGVFGLYKGFGLKLVRAIPASMIGFLTYETVAQWIRG